MNSVSTALIGHGKFARAPTVLLTTFLRPWLCAACDPSEARRVPAPTARRKISGSMTLCARFLAIGVGVGSQKQPHDRM